MLAGVLLQQRGRRGARAAASWALGDDGPLYCLARRGGVWRKRGGPGGNVGRVASCVQRCSRDAPGKRWRAHGAGLLSTLVCVCR